MPKLTADDVAQMTVADRVNAIAKLSPSLGALVERGRQSGGSDAQIIEHMQAALDLLQN